MLRIDFANKTFDYRFLYSALHNLFVRSSVQFSKYCIAVKQLFKYARLINECQELFQENSFFGENFPTSVFVSLT